MNRLFLKIRKSIVNKIVFSFGLVVFVLTGILSGIGLWNQRAGIKKTETELFGNMETSTRHEIEVLNEQGQILLNTVKFSKPVYDYLRAMAKVDTASTQGKSIDELEKALLAAHKPDFDRWVKELGVLNVRVLDNKGFIQLNFANLAMNRNQDASNLDYVQRAMATPDKYESAVGIFGVDGLRIRTITGVSDPDTRQMLGVLVIHFGFQNTFAKRLAKVLGGDVFLYMINTEGKPELTGQSDPNRVDQNITMKKAETWEALKKGTAAVEYYRAGDQDERTGEIKKTHEAVMAIPLKNFSGDVLGIVRVWQNRQEVYAQYWKYIGETLAILIAAIVAAGFIGRAIVKPIEPLAETMEKVQGGQLTARAAVTTEDEIGYLARESNKVFEFLEKTDAAKQQMQSDLMKMLNVVGEAANGDFTIKANVTEGEFGVLADSFNMMVNDLSKLIGKVRSAANQVSSTTQEILVSSEQMSKGAENQALQIANTTTAIDEMAVSIQRVSENADAAADSSQQTSKVAVAGGDTVRNSIKHMNMIRGTVQDTAQKIKALGESSLEIGEIVKVINNIANRTNLLALNATIEAAKAGESGKGFAVVADEVRKLADQASKASNDIATLIQGIQSETAAAVHSMEQTTKEVEEGVQMADTAGKSLEQIVQAVSQSTELIQEISLAAKQQAKASTGIVESMTQISQISKQTAAGATQTSQASNELMSMSEGLRTTVQTFKLMV